MHVVPLTAESYTRYQKVCISRCFVHHLFMYELREQQKKKDLAAAEGEIKTKLCHQLQRVAPVDTIAPDDGDGGIASSRRRLHGRALLAAHAGTRLAVNRAENRHRGPETILKNHHRGLVQRLASTPMRESQPASWWRC